MNFHDRDNPARLVTGYVIPPHDRTSISITAAGDIVLEQGAAIIVIRAGNIEALIDCLTDLSAKWPDVDAEEPEPAPGRPALQLVTTDRDDAS
jgi:hypothetical protein